MSLTRRSVVSGAAAFAVASVLPAGPLADGLTSEERAYLALLPAHVDAEGRARVLEALRNPDPLIRLVVRKFMLLPRDGKRRVLAWMEADLAAREGKGRNPS